MMAQDAWTYLFVAGWTFFLAVAAMFMLRHQPGFDATYVAVGIGLAGLWSGIS